MFPSLASPRSFNIPDVCSSVLTMKIFNLSKGEIVTDCIGLTTGSLNSSISLKYLIFEYGTQAVVRSNNTNITLDKFAQSGLFIFHDFIEYTFPVVLFITNQIN